MITEHIEKFMKAFTEMTKEESDYVYEILKWDNEKKMAFFLAKRMFEEKD